MAKKENLSAALERTYTIPLRREYLKVPNWKRTEKAVIAVREFMIRHMKSREVKIGKALNEELWKHGIKNPPHHIKVNAVKDEKGIVKVDLFGAKEKVPKAEAKGIKKKVPEEERKVEANVQPSPEDKKQVVKVHGSEASGTPKARPSSEKKKMLKPKA